MQSPEAFLRGEQGVAAYGGSSILFGTFHLSHSLFGFGGSAFYGSFASCKCIVQQEVDDADIENTVIIIPTLADIVTHDELVSFWA